MTIHTGHPFAAPEDPLRRLRGRLGGAVTLWTAGSASSGSASSNGVARAGLTVSSLMAAGGEPGRLLALLDPDSDLRAALEATGRGVVHLLQWEHRDLAEAFAGQAPAPGGPFTLASWEQTEFGPRLTSAPTTAYVEVESFAPTGWSDLVVTRLVSAVLGDDGSPLEHRRGRYRRADPGHAEEG